MIRETTRVNKTQVNGRDAVFYFMTHQFQEIRKMYNSSGDLINDGIDLSLEYAFGCSQIPMK